MTEYQKFEATFKYNVRMYIIIIILVMFIGKYHIEYTKIRKRNIELEKSIDKIRNKYMGLTRKNK